MTNFIPGITTCVVLLALLMFINVGQQMHKTDPNADISKFTNATEDLWANTSVTLANASAQSAIDMANSTSPAISVRINKVVYKAMDAFGYIAVQVANTGVEYGFQNPDFKAKEASDALMLLIALEILVVLFAPICVVIYGIYLLVVWVHDSIITARDMVLTWEKF